MSVKNVTDLLNISLLKKIKDERNFVVVGDVVIATFFSGGFETFEFVVNFTDDNKMDLTSLGASKNGIVYCIDFAHHVVKKSTYDKVKLN